MPSQQMKQCSTTVVLSPTSNPNPTVSQTTMPGSADLRRHELIKISTANSKHDSRDHLLTIKAVLHFKWVSYYLPSKN